VISCSKLAGTIFKINIMGQQIVFIAGAALVEEVCDEKRFRKAVMGPVAEIRHAVHDALFSAYDNEPSWGIAHRIMAPLLTPVSVQKTFVGMRDTAMQMTAKWARVGNAVNVTNELRRMNLKSAMVCLFGQCLDCLEGPEPPVIQAMDEAALESMKRPNRPKLVNRLVYQGKFDRETRTMRDFAAKVVAKRREDKNQMEDMLHALLHGKDPETGKSFTEAQIIDEVVTLLIATTTAPCLVSFAVYYLLKNPQEMVKGRKEIDEVVGSSNLEYSHLERLPYCEAILREALRMSAPAPGFNIEPLPSTTGPVMLASGRYEVPKNQAMIVLLHTANRDPTVFEDPEEFKPERMLGNKYEKIPSSMKKGFGNGKRECTGKVYGWQWSLVTLISILMNVEILMADASYVLKMDNGAYNVKPVELFVQTKTRE
jgi:cytochrome P450